MFSATFFISDDLLSGQPVSYNPFPKSKFFSIRKISCHPIYKQPNQTAILDSLQSQFACANFASFLVPFFHLFILIKKNKNLNHWN